MKLKQIFGRNEFILLSGIIGVFLIAIFSMKFIYPEVYMNYFPVTEIDYKETALRVAYRYRINSEDTFTGRVYKEYPNGQRKWLHTYVRGLLNGKMLAWHENGQQKLRGTFHHSPLNVYFSLRDHNGFSEGSYKIQDNTDFEIYEEVQYTFLESTDIKLLYSTSQDSTPIDYWPRY